MHILWAAKSASSGTFQLIREQKSSQAAEDADTTAPEICILCK